MSTDQRPATEAEKTPLFIGQGVHFAGTIRHAGDQDERALIMGEFTGDLDWNGVLHVARGGKLVVDKTVRCREMVISGEIVAATQDAVIETGLLRLGKTAVIEVTEVSVPPGGLEQMRGAVVNAKLRMTADNRYAQQDAPASAAPSLSLVASNAAEGSVAAEGSHESGGEPPRFLTTQHRAA